MIGRNTSLISPGALGRVTGIKLTYPTGIQVEVGSVEQAKVLLQLCDSPQEANPTKEGDEELNPTYHFNNLHAPLHDRKTTLQNPLPYNAPYMRNRHRSMTHAQWCLININRLPKGQIEEYVLSHNRKVCPQWVFSVPIILNVHYGLKEEAKRHGAIWMSGFREWILPPMKSLVDMPRKFRPLDMTPYGPYQIHFSIGRTLNPDYSFRTSDSVIFVPDSEEEPGSVNNAPELAPNNGADHPADESVAPEHAPEEPRHEVDAANKEAVEKAKEEDDEPIDAADKKDVQAGADESVAPELAPEEPRHEVDAANKEAVEGAKEEDDEPIDAADKKDVQAGAAAAADANSTEDEYNFPTKEELMDHAESLFGPCGSHRELDGKSKIMLGNSEAAENNATALSLLSHGCNAGRCSSIRKGDRSTPHQWPQAVNNGSPATSGAPAGGRNANTPGASQDATGHTVGVTPFAAALANGQDGQNTSDSSNSSVVSPRIEARRSDYRKNSVQTMKTTEAKNPPENIFFPSLDPERCPELLPRQSTPKTKRSKLQPESSSEDDDSDSNNSYQANSFLANSNESSCSGSFKTDDCEESESEFIDQSEEDSEPFSDDYPEDAYESSDEDDDDDETPYVPPKRSSRKRKIIPTKPFEYAKRNKVSTKKQKTIQDCAPYACTTEKDGIAFLPTNAGNSANNTDDSDANGSSI